MAESKKSFLLYTDVLHTVKKLTDIQAGLLFKHILSYVNDENPVIDDFIIEIAFEPIKQSLKRDLKKYESIIEDRSKAGRLGGLRSGEIRKKKKEANEAIALKTKQTKQRQANEAVNDNVIVIDKEKEKKEKEKNKYAEFVFMQTEEYEKLIQQHGEGNTKTFIEILNNYKGSNGKKYKSDYMAILNWVIDKIKKEGKYEKLMMPA